MKEITAQLKKINNRLSYMKKGDPGDPKDRIGLMEDRINDLVGKTVVKTVDKGLDTFVKTVIDPALDWIKKKGLSGILDSLLSTIVDFIPTFTSILLPIL
jgi:hypothetical protein